MKHISILLGALALSTIYSPAYGQRQGPENRPQPPSAEEVAARIVVDFDANSTLALDADELTEALTFLHENRPPPPRRGKMDTDRPPRPEPDLAAMATDLVMAFDVDGDQQLSESELVETFTELHSRRPGPPPHRESLGQGDDANRKY
ncbi:hypothetical protein G0Q06_03125 [Puniceicoccales bacterium CK1056]|uniref:EF-hand domain-containing protein n=1 Tax=Oceanipulchritudo coccoides TaxID=2706888 RepID=A0A6B2M0X1_9BACT|nr:hypothetical protein [Oceanipulchritudo coccoides]NDV61435.1 hypothetical protein [Oceanipulchritudo coccoides]